MKSLPPQEQFSRLGEVEVKIKKLRPVKLPQYQHDTDSGVDLCNADKKTVLKPGEIKLIGTGISVEIPPGFEIQVRPRSGLAAKSGVTVLNTPGTIDAAYRGEIKVILINLGQVAVTLAKNERIAQAVLMKVEKIKWKSVKELRSTGRAAGGFGSTGRKS